MHGSGLGADASPAGCAGAGAGWLVGGVLHAQVAPLNRREGKLTVQKSLSAQDGR